MGHRATPRRTAAGPALVGVCAIAGVSGVIRATRPLLNGPDPFWHWDLGRRIVTDRSLPTMDPYSFLTEGREWILNQWGTDLIIGLITQAGGLWLLALVTAAVVAFGVGLTAREMWQRAPSLITVPLLGLVMLTSMSSWVLRGTLATLVCLPLLLRELNRSEARPWVLGLLFLFWANLHAAFLIGLALLLIDRLGRLVVAESRQQTPVLWRSAILLGTSLVAVLVNPYGPRYLVDVVALAAGGTGTGISEWAPPEVLGLRFLPFTVLAAVVLLSVAVAGRREGLPDAMLVVGGTFLGLTAQRNTALGAVVVGIVGAPYVVKAWHQIRQRDYRTGPRNTGPAERVLACLVLGVSLLTAIVILPRSDATVAHAAGIPGTTLIDDLNALNRPARVAVSATWAPAVGALTDDHVRTEVDGRAELFNADERAAHLTTHMARTGWNRTLDAWCATDAIVPTHSPLHDALTADDTWRVNTRTSVLRQRDQHATWFARDRMPASCEVPKPSG